MKRKRCRHCNTLFTPFNSFQRVCSDRCGLEWARSEKGKAEAKKAKEREHRRQRRGLETKPELMKKAQQAFNAYIRARDKDQPCISCGAPPRDQKYGGTRDCSHYRSTGSMPALRFHTENAHASCKKCNRDLSGNIVEYRLRLIDRIGKDRVEWLEGPHESPHWSHEDLRVIGRHFRRQARQLEGMADWCDTKNTAHNTSVAAQDGSGSTQKRAL